MEILEDNNCDVIHLPDIVEQAYGLYPALDTFSNGYTANDYHAWVDQSNGEPMPAPLAVYIQDELYRQGQSQSVAAIRHELLLQGRLIAPDRPMQQLLCAGAMLMHYSDEQLHHVIESVQKAFVVAPESLSVWCADVGTSLLPFSRLRVLKALGFSRVRFIYQNDRQARFGLEELIVTLQAARETGFQITLEFPAGTHYPAKMFGRLKVLLQEVSRVRILTSAGTDRIRIIDALHNLGFIALNASWYVRTEDHWLRAKMTSQLYWSLLGFSEMHSPDIIGIGAGAISVVGECYSANTAVAACYQAKVMGQGRLPIVSGLELEADDVLRREIMGMIFATSCIHVSDIEAKWGICFTQFFAQESRQLRALEGRGWLSQQEGDIVITAQGHQELSFLCQLFDRRARAVNATKNLTN